MQVLYKVTLSILALVLFPATAIAFWFFVYTADLPDIDQLAQFAPSTASRLTDSCGAGMLLVLPFPQIGKRFEDAFAAAEPNLSFSDQIARRLMCNRPERAGRYQINTLRLSWRLQRRFSQRELFTIYANTAYFGSGVTGLARAAAEFLGKDADELGVADAALLAGVLRAPDRFSPFEHPDSALERRNKVLENMVADGKLTRTEASEQEATPLITFFWAEAPRLFLVSLPGAALKVLLKSKEAREGLELANDSEIRDPSRLFRAAEVHLSDSNEEDLIVLGVGSMRGADNDWFWVVASPHQNAKVVLFAGANSLEILNSRTNGHRDIQTAWSSASETIETTYHFDGRTYKAFTQRDFDRTP